GFAADRSGLAADGSGFAGSSGFAVDREPTVDMARAAVAAAREHGADLVVAVGGGSGLDLGQAVAMLLGNGGGPPGGRGMRGAGARGPPGRAAGGASRSAARACRTSRYPPRPVPAPR